MMHPLPPLIIISGPPGAGKSTLARPLANALGLPLFEKDPIKERMADAIGDHAFTISRELGLAAIAEMYAIANELLRHGKGVIIESTFPKSIAEPDLEPLVAISRPILIHIRADQNILLSRYQRRMGHADRHPVHSTGDRLGQLRQYLLEGFADLMDLDVPRIVIDTTFGPIDVAEVAMMVREKLDQS